MAGRGKRAGARRRSPAGHSSPRRGGGGGGGGGRRNPASRGRSGDGDDEDIPQIYREMLSEARQSASTPGLAMDDAGEGPRAVKRRRVGEGAESRAVPGRDEGVSKSRGEQNSARSGGIEAAAADKPVQTVYDVDASDESGMEWEDVDLGTQNVVPGTFHEGSSSAAATAAEGGGVGESLQLTLGNHDEKAKQKAAVQRRKPATALEKKWRLDIHKVHVLCLLSHVQMRNSWCNDEEAQKSLKKILPKNVILCLNPKPELPQFTRSTTFADGLRQAAETFRRKYKITAPGLRRPKWLEKPEEVKGESFLSDSAEILSSKDDFRSQATTLRGSRDLGAQLFCALLRGVGVESRLVCSLQVLPFSGVAKGESPKKPEKEYIVLSDADTEASPADTSTNTPASQSTPSRRPGMSKFSSKALGTKLGSVLGSDSAYPVFWVEAFNEAMQKWVTVDPMVTNTVGKPDRLEPPSADRLNNMSYVVAFEDDLSARDITRRYVKSFNSKTRKTRVEQTKGGEKWWSRTMKVFERPFLEDRDQVEFGELTSKAAAEGMPRNVQDFKDHPIYALERHLRRNEVIHPKREIGKVGLSKLTTNKKSQQLESVYRREDVHVVKSADGWYRQGRSVKAGEQPIKRVSLPRGKLSMLQDNPNDDDGPQDTTMYAAFQTELYQPPPVVNGKVPKNNYGNIDVYVPSMVPQGGVHLKHPDAAVAAKILGINYADAVTGFQFKGRQGTAVVQGIVAAVEYQAALCAVLSGLDDQRAQAEEDRKTAAALAMWKRLLTGLRVAERIESYTFERGDQSEEERARAGSPYDSDDVGGGGFLPEDGQAEVPPRPASPAHTGLPLANSSAAGNEKRPAHENEDGGHGSPGQSIRSSPVAEPSIVQQTTSREPVRFLKSNKSSQKPRYHLIVVPNKDARSAEAGRNLGANSQEKPTDSRRASAEQHAGLNSAATEKKQDHNETSKAAPIAGSSAAEPVVIESSTAASAAASATGRSVSVEEGSGLPELVHSDTASEASGSMLSHDPEDEDAVPDWLLSD